MARARLATQLLTTISTKAAVRAVELDRLRVDKKRIEDEINALTPQVMKDLKDGNLKFPDDSSFDRLIKVPGSNSRIDPAKLLAKGVKSKVITACTDITKYEYPRLIRKGETDERVEHPNGKKVKGKK